MMVEIKFSHRYKPDGTWQSICPESYKTVTESREESRPKANREHPCLPLTQWAHGSDRLAFFARVDSTQLCFEESED